jgi:hypothetical protein
MSRPAGRLPDFLIIGAAKSGTTSLAFYLSLHPEIHMGPKEPRKAMIRPHLLFFHHGQMKPRKNPRLQTLCPDRDKRLRAAGKKGE